MATKINSKDSLKNTYIESKKRIKIILNSLSKYSVNSNDYSQPQTLDVHTRQLVADLCSQIYQATLFEPNTQYSQAILAITKDMEQVLQQEYWENCKNNKNCKKDYQHPLFIVKKGAEILHSLLYRDLRRKQFSSQENEIYQSYVALSRKLSAQDLNEKAF